ncbi:MAG: tryptophan 7-halogenase [Kiloniellales bacterium]|nr:tryptophan 7-halogenase [Kiloniellales bacterium]
MAEPIREITIVGGGTAGWMAAVFLITRLNKRPGRPPVRVTLVESPNVPTIGVGEATVPGMRELLKQLEIPEATFIERCNASFKLGVRFVNWDKQPDGSPGCYDHPFDGLGVEIEGTNPAYHYHRFGRGGALSNLGDALSPSTRLIEERRGPKTIDQDDYDYAVGYAYHLDAGLFAGLLREIAVERGVLHVLDDVDDLERDDRGHIAALILRERGRWPVELVIDCTGFRSLILQTALEEPFESFSPYLFNDKALAVQIPHKDVTGLEPCTRSTALGAGWVWRVPLYSRVGTGYVFSSRFRSDQEAIDEFLQHLGDEGVGVEPRVIPMRIGRARRTWVGNCVAVGLSGGFIEPLESTAIFIIEAALRWLVSNLPDRDFDPALQARYNEQMQGLYEEVRDFIALHYLTSNRRDSAYWRVVHEELEVPDSLKAKLPLWRERLPEAADFERSYLFGYWSYLIVLFGKHFYDDTRFARAEGLQESEWRRFEAWVEQQKAGLVAQLPNHFELLNQIRSRARPRPMARPEPAFVESGRPSVPLPGQGVGVQISWKQGRPEAPDAESIVQDGANLL